MEPRIQYAKTGDGVNIGFWTIGDGPPLVIPPILFASHAQLEWTVGSRRVIYEFLARRATVIRYDCRGMGVSDRDAVDFSAEAAIRDLDAVAKRLGLDRFVIFSQPLMGPVALSYAHRLPERVSHVIHRVPAAENEGDRLAGIAARLRRMRAFIDDDWELYSEIAARVITRWESKSAPPLAELIRASHTPGSFSRSIDTVFGGDMAFPKLEMPVLLLYGMGQDAQAAAARRIAADLPSAHVVGVPNLQIGLYSSSETTLNTLLDFINAPSIAGDISVEYAALRSAGAAMTGLSAILFADIVGSADLTERLGDDSFREKAWALDSTLRAVIREHDGTPIEGKLLGDGVLAVFPSARHSIEAALACSVAGDQAGFPLHLGLHAGDVIHEETAEGRTNVYGGAVNIASRISGLSAPGEVLVSDIVRGLARTSAGVAFEDRGEQELKGVRVWVVRKGE